MIGRTGVVGVGLATFHLPVRIYTLAPTRPTRATFERVVRVLWVAATSGKRSPVDTVEGKICGEGVGGLVSRRLSLVVPSLRNVRG